MTIDVRKLAEEAGLPTDPAWFHEQHLLAFANIVLEAASVASIHEGIDCTRAGKLQAHVISTRIAAAIRALYVTGNYTQRQLAEKFGCCHSTVGYVIRGERWA